MGLHRETPTQAAARAAIKAFTELVETAAAAARTPPLPLPCVGLDLKGASIYTGAKISFLRKAIRDGNLPARRVGKKFLILRHDLESFITALPLARRNHET